MFLTSLNFGYSLSVDNFTIVLSVQGTPVSERAIPVAIFETNAGQFLH